jgi:type II secretory pathway pseudopilin PulG
MNTRESVRAQPLPPESGVTLLDMVIAVAIVVVLLSVAYPGLKVANDTMATGGARDRLERAGDQLLKSLTEELRAGLVTDIVNSPPSITICQPRRDVKLSDISEEGGTPWSNVKRTIRYREVEHFSESAAKEDINGDGDQTDEFTLGLLELVQGAGASPLLTRAQVILGYPNHREDVTGDGVDDPLFVQDGRSLRFQINLVGRDAQNRLLRTTIRSTLHLRNVQEN